MTIIETERLGDCGGILYNFVGIRGPESRIISPWARLKARAMPRITGLPGLMLTP